MLEAREKLAPLYEDFRFQWLFEKDESVRGNLEKTRLSELTILSCFYCRIQLRQILILFTKQFTGKQDSQFT